LALSREEIEYFIQGYASGEIPDYQASAWAMAVFIRGMDEEETSALTIAMAHSGQVLDLSSVAPKVLDKHSSGGVGDKTTLVVAPLVACLGLPVGKMSGRGLGFSGGTLDKLESIPGFRADLSKDEFVAQLKKHGIVVSGQTHDLAPADGKLYGLRDVTATVGSLPLIASSIMSKKIAAGAHIIVLDVKVGLGAFMKTEETATALAKLMVKIGHQVDRSVAAVVGAMDQPLGNAVGNALEVIEAIETLKGRGPADLLEHCMVIAEQMVLLAGAAADTAEARSKLRGALDSGRALGKFGEWIAGQGGDRNVVDDYALLPHAPVVRPVLSPQDGFVTTIDAEVVGRTVVGLGGGREKKNAPIDYDVGVVFERKVGDHVTRGQPLLTLHARDHESCDEAEQRLMAACELGRQPPPPPRLIRNIIR
ncbi:MAG: thymidine phosphorylase, partial [Chloroflexi bacterium]|nr:thymidine phosphorylase [Chloroflexota bacterium]